MSEKVKGTDTRRVSVIIGVYKESVAAVAATLENLWSQTRPPEQIVVVLDCPDNAAVKTYLDTARAREPRLTVVHNDHNLGLGASLNRAVAVAKGDLLARADLDDWSEPTRLERQVAHFTQSPDTDLLFTQWREHYEDDTERDRLPTRTAVQHIKKNFFTQSILLHPSLMIRREILERHPYPEMARPEDFVLFLELIRLNYRFDLIEEVLYHYRVDRTERYQKVRVYSRNLLPHLLRHLRHYWHNPYYYLYLSRITGEYLISRNRYLYHTLHRTLARLWKLLSRG